MAMGSGWLGMGRLAGQLERLDRRRVGGEITPRGGEVAAEERDEARSRREGVVHATARPHSGQGVAGERIALVELPLDEEAGPEAVDGPEPLPARTRAIVVALVIEVARGAERRDQRRRRREVGHRRGGTVAQPRGDVHAAEEPRGELDVGAPVLRDAIDEQDGSVEELTGFVEGPERLRVLRGSGQRA